MLLPSAWPSFPALAMARFITFNTFSTQGKKPILWFYGFDRVLRALCEPQESCRILLQPPKKRDVRTGLKHVGGSGAPLPAWRVLCIFWSSCKPSIVALGRHRQLSLAGEHLGGEDQEFESESGKAQLLLGPLGRIYSKANIVFSERKDLTDGWTFSGGCEILPPPSLFLLFCQCAACAVA